VTIATVAGAALQRCD